MKNPISVCATSLRAGLFFAPLVFAPIFAAEVKQPDQISDLHLWLRAADLATLYRDGQEVTRWPDRSGKGYDAVYEPRIPQAKLDTGVHHAPTFKANALGNKPAVAFDANQRQTLILNRAGHALNQSVSGFTAFLLVRPTLVYGPAPAPGVEWSKNRYLFITHVSNYDTRVSIKIIEGTGEVQLRSRPIPGQKIDGFSSFDGAQKVAVSGDAWHRLAITVDYKAKVSRIVIDGAILTHALPPTTMNAFEEVPNPITGFGSNTLGEWLTCQIGEVACYGKALSEDELKAFDAYLCQAYGLGK